MSGLALWLLLAATAPTVTFTPLEPRFAETADYYRRLWDAEGARILAALERESGFAFPARPLEIILRDGRPMTGYGCSAIRLRGTYTGPTATGTLIHELGHCLTAQMPRTAGLDDHRDTGLLERRDARRDDGHAPLAREGLSEDADCHFATFYLVCGRALTRGRGPAFGALGCYSPRWARGGA